MDQQKSENTNAPKGRLQQPIFRFLSISAVLFSVGIFFYSLANLLIIIPLATILFFLLLWYFPIFWTWIEEIFGKRPQTKWGRFSLNLVLAMLAASMAEDILELVKRGLYFLFHLLRGY